MDGYRGYRSERFHGGIRHLGFRYRIHICKHPSLDTRVVVFDTEVVDLTEQCANDPVDMLFGIQLGGGTDIHKSVAYCEQFIEEPKTLFIIISDLYEGGNQAGLIRRMRELREAGSRRCVSSHYPTRENRSMMSR